MKARSTLLAATLLASSLLLTGCSGLDFSPGNAQSSANPSPTQTTSTAIDKVVKVNGVKYKVISTTFVTTWGKKDGSFGADNYQVASVVNRDGKQVYERKVFDDSAWFTQLAKWTVDEPDFKNLDALKAAIKNAS